VLRGEKQNIKKHLVQLDLNQKINNMKQFLSTWYPIIIAFICMCYSIGLGLFGLTEEAQYSAHWAGTILLFAIAIRQRRGR
jgi:hypothetical protein